jgi:hypothetical protein
MAKPRRLQGAPSTEAPAPAPAPAPTPAPASAPVAAKPAEPKREEPKREERKSEKKPPTPVRQAEPPALPEPTGSFAQPTATQREATVARALAPSTAAKAAQAAAVEATPQPAVAAGGAGTTAVYVPSEQRMVFRDGLLMPAELDPYQKYYEALDRVEELRRQGKIGQQVRNASTAKGDMEVVYRPALRPLKVTPKPSREPIARQPILRDVEMPTAEELDIRVVGARKMQEVMRNRGLTKAQQEENQMEIARLEDQLSTQRDQSTFDPEKSRAEQMQARAEQMGAISSQLKQLAAQQRGLTERLATQNATLREYGMTDEEIKSR